MPAEKPNLNGSQKDAIGVEFHRLIENGAWDKAMESLASAPDPGNGDGKTNPAELTRAIENRDWKTVDELTGMSPEEAERILREDPMIDGADFSRLLEELDRREGEKHVAQSFAVPKPSVQTPGASSPSA